MTFRKLVSKYSKIAKDSNKEESAVKQLVLELSGYNGADFVVHLDDELDEKFEIELINKINEYLINNHPIQHILGYSYFFGYKFKVCNEVLIPRPETEELVGYVLGKYDDVFEGKNVTCVDVGAGSGAIAIALKKEEPKMKLYGTDISPEAIEVAKENAISNNADVTFLVGDMLEPLIKNNLKFDILVSNPPYIPQNEEVQDIVLDNEPHVALFGGEDGMKFYEIILSNASKVLNFPNIIAFEHSYTKGKEMMELSRKYFPDGEISLIKDLSGKDRMTIIYNK